MTCTSRFLVKCQVYLTKLHVNFNHFTRFPTNFRSQLDIRKSRILRKFFELLLTKKFKIVDTRCLLNRVKARSVGSRIKFLGSENIKFCVFSQSCCHMTLRKNCPGECSKPKTVQAFVFSKIEL